jgi:hypothetical protein
VVENNQEQKEYNISSLWRLLINSVEPTKQSELKDRVQQDKEGHHKLKIHKNLTRITYQE